MKANILKRPPLGVCAIFAGFTLLAGASAAQTETPQPEIPKWQQSLEQEMAGSQSQEWTGNIKEELKEWEQHEAERKELERQEQARREEAGQTRAPGAGGSGKAGTPRTTGGGRSGKTA